VYLKQAIIENSTQKHYSHPGIGRRHM